MTCLRGSSRLVAAAAIALAPDVAAAQQRPLTLDDVFDLHEIGDVAPTPAGDAFAVVVTRPWGTFPRQRSYAMFGREYSDVWLLQSSAGRPRNLTNGVRDTSGYWNPVWSPDGRYLALLSARRDGVDLRAWARASGAVRLLSRRAPDLSTSIGASWQDGFPNPVAWADNGRVVMVALPEGEQPAAFMRQRLTMKLAPREWAKAAAGVEPSVSVLESGVANPSRADRQVLVIDVRTGRTDVVADGRIDRVNVSPDGRYLAIVGEGRLGSVSPGRRAPVAGRGLGVVPTAVGTPYWLAEASSLRVSSDERAVAWSPGGDRLAFVGTDSGGVGRAHVVHLATGQSSPLGDDLRPSAIGWSRAGGIAVRGVRGGASRADWWYASGGDLRDLRNLTARLPDPVGRLVPLAAPHTFAALADGRLWILDGQTGAARELASAHRFTSIAWAPPPAPGAPDDLVMRVGPRAGGALYRVRISERSVIDSIPVPSAGASLAGYVAPRGTAILTAALPTGSFLWTGTAASSRLESRLALDTHLAGIAEGKRMFVRYRGADGDSLGAILLLPVGYEEGRRYPMVTWVYSGMIHRDTVEVNWLPKNHAHPNNLQLLAGRGYAVLLPSMPRGRAPHDPYLDVPKGVLPAIDRVIELGIADSSRLAVIGQSQGGFDTFALVTQTSRFRAAVAMYGFTDLASRYGTFSAIERYSADAAALERSLAFWEGLTGIGTPWADRDRFVRNSPVFMTDRVTTPLMIIHGDLDYIPIQQSEEFFSGLLRLGKRARFVRYWGEEHGLNSPANVRHRWREITAWLAEHLR